MIPGPAVQPLSPFPIAWGGLSVNNYLPVFPLGVGSSFPSSMVGRSFYGSVFYPYFGTSGTPMSRWGDEWLGADVFDAGARLAYWGDAMIATDPWIMPHYFDALMNRNNFPFGGFPFPWIPAPTNLFGTPQGMAPVSNSGKGQPHSAEEADLSRRDTPPDRGTPDTHEPPPAGAAPPPPATPPK